MSDPTATVSTKTTSEHHTSTPEGAVCNPRFRSRAARRNLQHLDPGTRHHRVERISELPGPVPDQEPEPGGALPQVHQQVPRLLHSPRAVRLRGHAQEMNMAGAGFDHEEDIDA